MIAPRWFIWLVTATIVLFFLVIGRSFLVPIAVALVLFSLLVALINFIARLHIGAWSVPRPLATLLGLVIIGVGLLMFASVLSSQIEAVVAASPRYVGRIEELISQAAEYVGRDIASDIRDALTEINIAASIPGVLGSAGNTVTAVTLIVLYIGFMFVEQRSALAKFDRLFPDPERAEQVRSVLGSIFGSVQRYFAIKLFVSLLTGLAAYAVMRPLGLDFAETWALLAVLLNFIPNIGSAAATILPAIVALVQFDTLGPFLVIALGVGAIQLMIGNFVEPALMGRSLNLSPFVIIISLMFWAYVWGIVGMFLAVPFMMIGLIVCSHIPAWRPIAVLLSRKGDIPDPDSLGRRLL
jgi:AI-2 transport protein TqsA